MHKNYTISLYTLDQTLRLADDPGGLQAESQKIELKFAKLVAMLKQSLDGRIPPIELSACLAGFSTYRKVFKGPNQCMFREKRQQMQEAQSIAEIWGHTLRLYIFLFI